MSRHDHIGMHKKHKNTHVDRDSVLYAVKQNVDMRTFRTISELCKKSDELIRTVKEDPKNKKIRDAQIYPAGIDYLKTKYTNSVSALRGTMQSVNRLVRQGEVYIQFIMDLESRSVAETLENGDLIVKRILSEADLEVSEREKTPEKNERKEDIEKDMKTPWFHDTERMILDMDDILHAYTGGSVSVVSFQALPVDIRESCEYESLFTELRLACMQALIDRKIETLTRVVECECKGVCADFLKKRRKMRRQFVHTLQKTVAQVRHEDDLARTEHELQERLRAIEERTLRVKAEIREMTSPVRVV